MNTIFKYNANAKYSTKDLKGGYNSNNFSLLDVYLDEKGPSVKIQLLNIFKDHHIVAQPTPTTVGYDEWPLSLAFWRKSYNSHGKYRPRLNEYFHMYRCQLNFTMFCVTSAVGISWQHLNDPNLLVRSVYRFHVYFHIRLTLHELGIPLPHEDGFSKVKNAYIKSAYYSICDDYGVDADETWMYGDWFYTTDYGIFGHEVKATERSPSVDLTRWIITQSKGFTRKGIEQISRSQAYVDLVLTSQVQARSSIVGNSVPAVDAQEVFKSTFKEVINEDYSIRIDIERYQGVLEHALSKVDFAVGTGIYMLPSNLNLNIGKTKGHNNEILVSNTGMKIGSNGDVNRDRKKLPVVKPDVPKTVIPAARHDPDNLKMSHNTFDCWGWVDCLSFLVENKMAALLFTVGSAVVNALAFSGTNFVFSRLTDHGAKERKKHD